MKIFKCIILTLGIVLLPMMTIGQSLIVKYEEGRLLSDAQLASMPEIIRENAIKKYSYTLVFQDGVSYYSFDKDSYVPIDIKKGDTSTKIDNLSQLDKYYYKEIENNLMLSRQHNGPRIFNIKDTMIPWEWELTEETTEVSGLMCRKATATAYGVFFTVWYAEDIPLGIGPEFLDGLPGLIVSATNGQKQWIATEIKQGNDVIEIEKPIVKGETHTLEQMNEYVHRMVRNFQPTTETTVDENTTTTRKVILYGGE